MQDPIAQCHSPTDHVTQGQKIAMFWTQNLKVKVQEAWLYLLRVYDFKSLINSSRVIRRYNITRRALKL